jgi:hypothetical protein
MLEANGVQMKDSYCFLTAALAKIPKMFALPTEVRKGHFPFRFISGSNIDNKG